MKRKKNILPHIPCDRVYPMAHKQYRNYESLNPLCRIQMFTFGKIQF